MPSTYVQIERLWIATSLLILAIDFSEERALKQKRYPLELGLVTWDNHHQFDKNKNVGDNSTDVVQFVKTNQQTPHYHKQDPERKHYRQEWIPGHVHHHAFIPAHAHHLVFHNHPYLAYRSSSGQVRPDQKVEFDEDDYSYRNPVGGYGVGAEFGGAGAGQGYQISFD